MNDTKNDILDEIEEITPAVEQDTPQPQEAQPVDTAAVQPPQAPPAPQLEHLTAYNHKNPKPPKQKAPTRRVGLFTMGIALIMLGILITGSLFYPLNMIQLAKFCPLILVFLGIEILWGNARKGDARIKYDFLSMFVCFLLICGAVAAACVPAVAQYWGPERYSTESRLENELEERLYTQLKSSQNIASVEATFSLEQMLDQYTTELTLDEALKSAYLIVSVTLTGDYKTAEEFAAVCKPILTELQAAGIKDTRFYSSNEDRQWEVYLHGVFAMSQTTEQIAQQVSMTDYTLDRYEADEALRQDGYDDGHSQGYNEGYEAARQESYDAGYDAGYATGQNENNSNNAA